MPDELVPRDRDLRVSDADREQVTEQLRVAAGDGRLTFDELDERLGAAYAARTYGDLEPLVGDLPAARVAARVAPQDTVELRQRSSAIKRDGRWAVPRRMVVAATSSSVRLDYTAAVIEHPEVEIELDVRSSGMTLILPAGAAADVDEVEVSSSASRNKAQGTPAPGVPHFRVHGKVRSSTLTIRHARQRRPWLARLLRLFARRRLPQGGA